MRLKIVYLVYVLGGFLVVCFVFYFEVRILFWGVFMFSIYNWYILVGLVFNVFNCIDILFKILLF